MEHGDVRPEIAMVSRIRVEVRGESMKAAEEIAFAALEHARLAGVMEGFVPSNGSYSDHFFNRPEVTRKYGEPPEPWGELGLSYAGRLSFVFEPESGYGGLKQYGVTVERDEDGPPHPTGERDHGFIVLDRFRPVTREHQWEGVTSLLVAEETGEAIIDDIKTIRDVIGVEARIDSAGACVSVVMDGWEDVTRDAKTLREAAEHARKAVVLMIHQAEDAAVDVEPMKAAHEDAEVEPTHTVTLHVADLNIPAVIHQLAAHPYRTLVVGTPTAGGMATEVLAEVAATYSRARGIFVRIDDEHPPDEWTLTTQEWRSPAQMRKFLDERIAGV